MKTIFQVLLFLIFAAHSNAQIQKIKKNNVSKFTVYRERFYPDTIKKKLHEYIVFNKEGNIIERYDPYENFQTPLEKYYYDSLEKLIKYTGFNKKGGLYEFWDWKTSADSSERKKYTPSLHVPNEYSWEESFNSWILLDDKNKVKIKIDTIPVSKKGENKLIRIVASRDIGVDTVCFYFGKSIIKQEQIRHFKNAKRYVYTIKFDSEGRITEKFPVNLQNEQPLYHFFYEYNKNGLLKRFIARYADNKIAERMDYIYEYFKE